MPATQGYAVATANKILNAICRNTSFSITAVYMQLHTANPGAAGTTAIATNTTRVAATSAFGTAASAGLITTTTDLLWTAVPATEKYLFASLWDASTAGDFLGSGSITGGAATSGNNWTLTAGNVSISLPVASS